MRLQISSCPDFFAISERQVSLLVSASDAHKLFDLCMSVVAYCIASLTISLSVLVPFFTAQSCGHVFDVSPSSHSRFPQQSDVLLVTHLPSMHDAVVHALVDIQELQVSVPVVVWVVWSGIV